MITGESDEPLPGTQPATKRMPAYQDERARRRKRRLKRVIAAEEKPRQHSWQPRKRVYHRTSSRSSRRKCKADDWNANNKSQLVQGWTASAGTKRVKAASEKARTKYQEAEALVASVADVLVNALEVEKVLREQTRTECTKVDSDYESKMTAAELHEVLRNVIDSVEKAWPPGAQSPIGLQEAVSVARATLMQTATRTSNSTHEKPKQDRKTNKVPKRRRIESLRADEGNKDFDDDSDGFTTSEDDATLSKDRSIKANRPSELAMMTGEDFERHFFGKQKPHAYTRHRAKTVDKHLTHRRQQIVA